MVRQPTTEGTNYITDAVRTLVGAQSEWMEAPHPVDESEIRRFFQATMDFQPRYFDTTGVDYRSYGALVAPPAFPMHMFRRPANDVNDPLAAMEEPDFDGRARQVRVGLPPMPIPLSSLLNGGYEYTFYSYVAVGERVRRRSIYRDVYQREGRSGTMVFVLIEDQYATAQGRPLLDTVNVQIMR